MMRLFKTHTDYRWLFLATITVSLLLSIWVGVRDDVVNPDGICYLMSAEYMAGNGLKGGMHFCPQAQWPLYSAMIYGLAQITHLSYLHAAQMLNAVFSIITAVSFLLIVQALGGGRRVLILASLALLFNHQLNVLRDDVIRDHGFWACFMLSVFVLLRFYKHPSMKLALGWSMSLLLATLFRIEGAIFLIFVPMTALFVSNASFRKRAHYFLMLNMPLMALSGMGLVWLLIHPQNTIDHLGRVSELFQQLNSGFNLMIARYHAAKAAIAQHVLPPQGVADAGPVTLLVWVCWYLYNVTITFSLGYLLLMLYAWFSRSTHWHRDGKVVVAAYVAINLIITMAFLAEYLFISKRYLVALTLLLMLWVPFAYQHLLLNWRSVQHKLFLFVVTGLMVSSAISGVIQFGYSKAYIKDAGRWVRHHVPKDAKVYTNDFQVMYYSNHFGDQLFTLLPEYQNLNSIAHGKWRQYDYLAIRLGKSNRVENQKILDELPMSPIQSYTNERGNHVVIYRVQQERIKS